MSIEYTYYCDAPPSADDMVDDEGEPREKCAGHAVTTNEPPEMPVGMLLVREEHEQHVEELHFCDWDCLLRYSATLPPTVRISL